MNSTISNSRPFSRDGSRLRELGFTLLELMISLTLMSVLLLTLWSFFSVYQKTFQASHDRITKSQIVRSLQDQLKFDLEHVFSPVAVRIVAEPDQTASDNLADDFGVAQKDSTVSDTFPTDRLPSGDDFDNLAERMPPREIVFEITQDRWLGEEIFLFGNAYGMIIQRYLVPDRRVESHEISTETMEDQLRIRPPELLDRVVYAFSEPLEAERQGIPSGLLRIELQNDQLPWIKEYSRSDLYALLESIRPELFEGLLGEGDLESDAEPTEFEQRMSSLDLRAQEEANRQRSDRMSKLTDQLDYVPEILDLRFRYFDGENWQDRWDMKQQNELPVAIEVGFQIDLDYEQKIKQLTSYDATSDQKPKVLQEEASLEEFPVAMELDDEIRTAQTMEIQTPNRFLIFLRTPDRRPQSYQDSPLDDVGP